MSRRSLEGWLRASVEAWPRGDREEYLGDVHPDWEFHTSGVLPGLRPVYRGPDGAAELWEAMRGPWEVLRTENFATWASALESVGLRE